MSMDNEPLCDVTDYCFNCEKFKKYINDEITLGEIRNKCARCRFGSRGGIFKADVVITAFELFQSVKLKKEFRKPYRGGRKSKIPDSVRQAMKNQHNEKISIRQIAKNTGYNKNTVSKILKEK